VKTVHRLIHRECYRSIGLITLGFLSLFVFLDMVDELRNVSAYSEKGYEIQHAFFLVLLNTPSHVYELLPICVLIGAIYVMARFASSSEFTILRTGGLTPFKALALLLKLGLVFVALTFVIGDYIAPWTDQKAQLLQSKYQGKVLKNQTRGAWLKEKRDDKNIVVYIDAIQAEGDMRDVRIQEFSPNGTLLTEIKAAEAEINDSGTWELSQVTQSTFNLTPSALERGPANISVVQLSKMRWESDINPSMIAATLLNSDHMRTIDLFRYIQHLKKNEQESQKYEISFWRKVFYPISSLVMFALALPFAYLHFRSGNISVYVFGGVLVGISFFLLNNLFGFIGNLRGWEPWLAAASPALLYTAISMSAFAWLVLRR
jgi:lipopolysaccharide export system permease protein